MNIYLSKHRPRSAASAASGASVITSSVHSYLRSSYGVFIFIYSSFLFRCSRDFILSSYHPIILSSYHRIMVLVFEHISLEISTTKRSERASLHPPSILTYGPPTASSASFILPFISDVREISIHMFKRFHPIMVLVFEYTDLSKHRIRSAASGASERHYILRLFLPTVLLRRLHNHLFFFSFHMFERFHPIILSSYHRIMVLLY